MPEPQTDPEPLDDMPRRVTSTNQKENTSWKNNMLNAQTSLIVLKDFTYQHQLVQTGGKPEDWCWTGYRQEPKFGWSGHRNQTGTWWGQQRQPRTRSWSLWMTERKRGWLMLHRSKESQSSVSGECEGVPGQLPGPEGKSMLVWVVHTQSGPWCRCLWRWCTQRCPHEVEWAYR